MSSLPPDTLNGGCYQTAGSSRRSQTTISTLEKEAPGMKRDAGN